MRVPLAQQGLNKIDDSVTMSRRCLWAISWQRDSGPADRRHQRGDTVLIIGAGPTGLCALLCAMLKDPGRIIVSEVDEERLRFVQEHYPDVLAVNPGKPMWSSL